MFPIIGFCGRQIWRIARSQIEIERIFSLVRILTSFRRHHLQSKKLANDPRISCKSSSRLADFFESDLNLKEEFEKFEKAFEKDKVVEL